MTSIVSSTMSSSSTNGGFKFRRSVSMLELNELTIIRDLGQDDLSMNHLIRDQDDRHAVKLGKSMIHSDADADTKIEAASATSSSNSSSGPDSGNGEVESNKSISINTQSQCGNYQRLDETNRNISQLGLIQEEPTFASSTFLPRSAPLDAVQNGLSTSANRSFLPIEPVQNYSSLYESDFETKNKQSKFYDHSSSKRRNNSKTKNNISVPNNQNDIDVMEMDIDMDYIGTSLDISTRPIKFDLDLSQKGKSMFMPPILDDYDENDGELGLAMDHDDEDTNEDSKFLYENTNLDIVSLDISIHSLNLGLDLDGDRNESERESTSEEKESESNATEDHDDNRNHNYSISGIHSKLDIRDVSPPSVHDYVDSPSPNPNTSTAQSSPIKPSIDTTTKKPMKSFLKKSASMLNFLPSQRRRSSTRRSNSPSYLIEEQSLSRSEQPPSILRKSTSMFNFQNNVQGQRSDLASNSNNISSSNMKRVTSFSTIEIREYDVTLGDNPGGRSGPPLSLDWKYNKHLTQVVDVDRYEETRPPRRSRIEMHMGSSVRSYILMREKGYSITDIKKAARSAADIRKKRDSTTKKIVQREIIKEKVKKIWNISGKKSSSRS